MDLINQIEKRKLLIISGILVIALASMIVTSLRGPVGYDPFWHLQMGKDWIENGLSPWIDHYSFTYNGQKISGPPVIFQGLLHLTVSTFGLMTGFKVFKFACFFLTLSATFLLLRQIKASAIVYAIVIPMVVYLLQTRAMVRPEIISYSLSIVALILYFRADNRIATGNMLAIIALMLVWVNYHSAILGYIIFFGFFLDCAAEQARSKAPASDWLKWLAWGGVIVAVGFLNPSFAHPALGAISFSPEWKEIILEYLPPTSSSSLTSQPGIYALISLSVITPVLAFRQHRFGMLFVSIVFIYFAFSMRRMITPSGIIIVMMAAYLLTRSSFHQRLYQSNRKIWSNLTGILIMVMISATLYSNVERAQHFMNENRIFLSRYPVALADYIIKEQISGNIFNTYSIGGYLIYRLHPQNRIYIDGRTGILYPLEHLKKHNELMKTNSPEVLMPELDKYEIDLIILQHSQDRHDFIQEMGDFGLEFLGARYSLYRRGKSNFPLLGMLLARPECWRPEMREELNSERKKMDEVLPPYSGLFPFADLVVGYSNSDDGKAFFDASISEQTWFDEMRRFAGYRFLETGHYSLTVYLLGGVEIRKPKDNLVSALAKIKDGDYETASFILEEFARTRWLNIRTEDIFIQYKLYQILKDQRDLNPEEQKVVSGLEIKLAEAQYPDFNTSLELDTKSLCRAPIHD